MQIHSLLVTRCKITRYSLQKSLVVKNPSLLVAKFARFSLLVAKFARYSLQKLLVVKNHSLLVSEGIRCKNHSLLVAEFARCKKSPVTRCKISSLLAAEVGRCKKSFVTGCEICLLLVAEVACRKKLLVTRYEKNMGTNVYLKPIKIGEFCLFVLYLHLIKNRNIPYTIQLASQKYKVSLSQLPTIKSFNEKICLS